MNIRDVIPVEEMERLLEAAWVHFSRDGELAINLCRSEGRWRVDVSREEMIGPDLNWKRTFRSEPFPTLAEAFAVAYSPENREQWRKGIGCSS